MLIDRSASDTRREGIGIRRPSSSTTRIPHPVLQVSGSSPRERQGGERQSAIDSQSQIANRQAIKHRQIENRQAIKKSEIKIRNPKLCQPTALLFSTSSSAATSSAT
jgi:hypothetical protein